MMPPARHRPLILLCSILCFSSFGAKLLASEATLYRAINLNGPSLIIGNIPWESGIAAQDFRASGNLLESQKVPLKPPTEAPRAQMLRSSVWGGKVDIELSNVPTGSYQVFVHVWEDNNNESYDLLLDDARQSKEFKVALPACGGDWGRF